MTRAGRRRKNKARYPNGHTKYTPPEQIPAALASRRVTALELSEAERDMRAEYPLGVCQARGLILKIEHQAGERWERQHNRALERARTPKSPIGGMVPSGGGSVAPVLDHKAEANDETLYLRSRDALRMAGSRAFHVVQNLVIHHHWPRFLDTERQRPEAAWEADARDLAALRVGLQAISNSMRLHGETGDSFAELIRGLEERYERRPSDDEIAAALLQFSVASLMLRREQRLRRER